MVSQLLQMRALQVVLRSPETAEHDPDYVELGRFPSREQALEFLSAGD